MRVGIVGHEAAKFTPETERAAKQIIANIIGNTWLDLAERDPRVVTVVSGECHLGGVDIWARERVEELANGWIKYLGYPPKDHTWAGGYKPRNLQIAKSSDIVHVIVVDQLPPDYRGMRFPLCYHCNTADHVKSGACWTARQAMKLGKQAEWHIIRQE